MTDADSRSSRDPLVAIAADGTEPVFLLLHGYGSHERDLPPLVEAIAPGHAWIAPRAPLPVAGAGFAWVPLSLPDPPDAAAVGIAAQQILDLVNEVAGDRPVVVMGFSQGGMMTIELLRRAPERFAAGVVFSGFVGWIADPRDAALAAAAPVVFSGIGDADPVIPAAAVDATARWLGDTLGVTQRRYRGLGHSIDRAEIDDVRAFLVTHGVLAETPDPQG